MRRGGRDTVPRRHQLDPWIAADAKGLKAYAGAAPVTRASGKSRSVTHRRVKNNRLAAAQRNLFGCLHHCLITGQHYDEATAFPARTDLPAAA